MPAQTREAALLPLTYRAADNSMDVCWTTGIRRRAYDWFNDQVYDEELIGVPHRVVISDRGLKDGQLEYQHRRDSAPTKVAVSDVFAFVTGRLAIAALPTL